MNNIRFENLFDNIAPPEGGIHGLREKLENLEKKRGLFSTPKFKPASAFAIVALLVLGISFVFMKPENKSFIDLAAKSGHPIFNKYNKRLETDEPVSVPAGFRTHIAVMRIETENKNVKFYLIENIAGETIDTIETDSVSNDPI
ncbi:MAG: hypothetical protein GX654_21320 [Desulfatiglans sp.]|nr:hypothetical protein [Desulfatiglans sp.]